MADRVLLAGPVCTDGPALAFIAFGKSLRSQFRHVASQSVLRASLPAFACQWSANFSASLSGSISGCLASHHAR